MTENPRLNFPRLVNLYCLRHSPNLTQAEMFTYWGNTHKQLVVSLQQSLKYSSYEQLYSRDSQPLDSVVNSLSSVETQGFDAVASLAYQNEDELIRGFFTLKTQLANLKLIKDELNFLDFQRSTLALGTEYSYFP